MDLSLLIIYCRFRSCLYMEIGKSRLIRISVASTRIFVNREFKVHVWELRQTAELFLLVEFSLLLVILRFAFSCHESYFTS